MINEEIKNISNINLAVKTTGNNKKSAIIFIHGSSQNADTWIPQLKDKKLNEKYGLIAFDLPGHGNSDWMTNPEEYKPRNIAGLLKIFVEEYKIENYILVGLSYGTNIIGEIKRPLPNCKGVVLVSACIVNDAHIASEFITAGANGHVVTAENPADEDLQAFASAHLHQKQFAQNFIETYRKTDPAFRRQLGKALLDGDLTDELLNIQNLHVPVCIAFGKNETLIKNNYLNDYKPVWNNKVVLIENAGHLINEENPDVFNDLLLSFASDVFK